MFQKIKVKKRIKEKNIMTKYGKNKLVITKMGEHEEIEDWPHTIVEYTAACKVVFDENELHLTGDKAATKRMREGEIIMDLYYYDTAKHIETIANKNNDPALPLSMGFELYAVRQPNAPKTFAATDGNNVGEIFVTYAKNHDADAYVAEIAEVIAEQEPLYVLGGASSIIFLVIPNKKPNTDYLIRLAYVDSSGLSHFSEPIPFRTRK